MDFRQIQIVFEKNDKVEYAEDETIAIFTECDRLKG